MQRAALEAIWAENRRWIASVILAHKPAWEELDDLLQEVAMTLVRKGHTIRSEDCVRSWLRTVAINAARGAARSGNRRPTVSTEDRALPPAQSLADQEIIEETDRTLECLSDLPESYREPLMMRALQGMSSRSIAEVMNISEATVDTRVARARRMLRSMLAETERNDDQTTGLGNPSARSKTPAGVTVAPTLPDRVGRSSA